MNKIIYITFILVCCICITESTICCPRHKYSNIYNNLTKIAKCRSNGMMADDFLCEDGYYHDETIHCSMGKCDIFNCNCTKRCYTSNDNSLFDNLLFRSCIYNKKPLSFLSYIRLLVILSNN